MTGGAQTTTYQGGRMVDFQVDAGFYGDDAYELSDWGMGSGDESHDEGYW